MPIMLTSRGFGDGSKPKQMIFIYNDTCSKCSDLSRDLADRGFSWDTIRYMDGGLSEELVDTIFADYEGAHSDLVRQHEPAWTRSGLDLQSVDLSELKRFVLAHPIVLQRPIVVVEGRVIIARPPEVLMNILTQTR